MVVEGLAFKDPIAEGGSGDVRVWICLAVILALGLALRSYQLGAESLWIDEALSWEIAHRGQAAIWDRQAIAWDSNPPLYFSLQQLGFAFGASETALRLPSMVAGVLTLPVVFFIGARVAGPGVALLATLLLALSPIHVAFSQEARAYALLFLAATTAVLGLILFLQSFRRREGGLPPRRETRVRFTGSALYGLGATAALYLHNTAVLLPFLANVVAFVWWTTGTRWSRAFASWWLAVNLIVLTIWLWWVPVLLAQTGSAVISWIDQPSLPGAAANVVMLYFPVRATVGEASRHLVIAVLLLLMLGLVGLAIWRAGQARPEIAVLLVFVVGVPAATWLVGLVLRPVWLDRTVLWPLGLGFVVLASGILALRRPIVRGLVATILLVWSTVGLAIYYSREDKAPWRELISSLETTTVPKDTIAYAPFFIRPLLSYYGHGPGLLDDLSLLDYQTPLALGGVPMVPLGDGDQFSASVLDDLTELAADAPRAWVIVRMQDQFDPDGRLRAAMETLGTIEQHQIYQPERHSPFWARVDLYLLDFE